MACSLEFLGCPLFQGIPFNLNSAVDLTAENAKIAKKGGYAWIALAFHSPGR